MSYQDLSPEEQNLFNKIDAELLVIGQPNKLNILNALIYKYFPKIFK